MVQQKKTAETFISARKRLAVCLYKLPRGRILLHNLRNDWNWRIDSHKIVEEVCQAIVKNMWQDSVEKFFAEVRGRIFVKNARNGK